MERKECRKCGERKPLDQFYRGTKGKGYRSSCIVCYRKMVKAREIALRDEINEKACARHHTRKGYARDALLREVSKGTIIRPDRCSKCGKKKKRIEAHHPDYSKPLAVVWLCTRCHGEAHVNNK